MKGKAFPGSRYTFGILTTVAKDIFRSNYHAELLSGIFRRAAGLGHAVKIFTPRAVPYHSLDEILLERELDGLLILTWRWIHPDIARLIETTRHDRVLVFNDPVPGLRVHHLYTDIAAGMRLAVGHLRKKKYHRIGMLHGPLEIPFQAGNRTIKVPFTDTQLKEKGFLQALRSKRVASNRSWIRSGKANTEAEGYRVMKSWLCEERLPEALVCGNDDLAFGALKAVRESSKKMAVIGFDDHERAKSFCPPLTTIRQPLVQMAGDAVALLVRQLEKPSVQIISRRYMPKLILRKTA